MCVRFLSLRFIRSCLPFLPQSFWEPMLGRPFWRVTLADSEHMDYQPHPLCRCHVSFNFPSVLSIQLINPVIIQRLHFSHAMAMQPYQTIWKCLPMVKISYCTHVSTLKNAIDFREWIFNAFLSPNSSHRFIRSREISCYSCTCITHPTSASTICRT